MQSAPTKVELLKCFEDGQLYIVIYNPSRKPASVIIGVSQENGIPKQYPDKDVGFEDMESALEFLKQKQQQANKQVRSISQGAALLGYVVIEPYVALYIAQQVRLSAILPGGHCIYTVQQADAKYDFYAKVNRDTESERQIVLSDKEEEDREEARKFVEKLGELQTAGTHYYCDSVDITRPFPSPRIPQEPCWEFVWNRWLLAWLRQEQLHLYCPILLQGSAETRPFPTYHGKLVDTQDQSLGITIICRRSRLHAGMRYLARGLNKVHAPGNEQECEQIVWRRENGDAPTEGNGLLWSSYIWRRGSVPVWWKVELKARGMGEAEILVGENGKYEGTYRYFQRLQQRYDPLSRTSSSKHDQQIQNPSTHLHVINLLRKGSPASSASESRLNEAFEAGVKAVRDDHKLDNIKIEHLDWHDLMGGLGLSSTVWCYWHKLLKVVNLQDGGHNWGFLTKKGGRAAQAMSSEHRKLYHTQWGEHEVEWYGIQNKVLRINCADSLDRTNVASFYSAIQVLVAQCRTIGLQLASDELKYNRDCPALNAFRAPKPPPGSAVADQIRKGMIGFGSKVIDIARNRANSNSGVIQTTPYNGAEVAPGVGEQYDSGSEARATGAWQDVPRGVQQEVRDEELDRVIANITKRSQKAEWGSSDPWGILKVTASHQDDGVAEFALRVVPSILTAVVEMFVVAGNITSYLYTGSNAMHISKILLFEDATSSLRRPLSNNSAILSIQRRVKNVMSDKDTQTRMEMFLGQVRFVGLRYGAPSTPHWEPHAPFEEWEEVVESKWQELRQGGGRKGVQQTERARGEGGALVDLVQTGDQGDDQIESVLQLDQVSFQQAINLQQADTVDLIDISSPVKVSANSNANQINSGFDQLATKNSGDLLQSAADDASSPYVIVEQTDSVQQDKLYGGKVYFDPLEAQRADGASTDGKQPTDSISVTTQQPRQGESLI